MTRIKDLRVAWRQFVGDPGYSAVVLIGLAVAVACCCLMAQFALERVLLDPHVPDPDRVVTLEFRTNIPGRHDDWETGAPIVFGAALRSSGAPVGAVSRVVHDAVGVRVGDRLTPVRFAFGDADLVDLFALKAVSGDLASALGRPDAIALTPSSAKTLFGRTDVVGRTLRVHDHVLTVAAVVRAPAPGEILQFEALAGIDSTANAMTGYMRGAWFNYTGDVYARLAPGHDAAGLGRIAQSLFDHGPGPRTLPPAWTAGGREAGSVRAIDLAHKWRADADSGRRLSELAAVAVSAALVLGLALVNYVNLTAVRTLARQREIALRKALGASPRQLILQFVFESIFAALAATGLGVLLAWLLAPAVGDMLDAPLAAGLLSGSHVACIAGGALLLGAATGLHPARIAVGVRCMEALAGRQQDEGAVARRLRRVVTALQFVVALVLAGAAMVLAWQNYYVETLPRGFRSDGLLIVTIPEGVWGDVPHALHVALEHDPAVTGVAWHIDPIASPWVHVDDFVRGDRRASMRIDVVEPAFFDVYGIAPIAGSFRSPRVVAPTPAGGASAPAETLAVIDDLGARALGFDSPQAAIGQLFSSGGKEPQRVVAVVPHLRQEDARGVPQPQIFAFHEFDGASLTVRGDDPVATRRAIDAAWRRLFPNDVLEVDTVAHQLAQANQRDRLLGELIAAASLLSLLLSGFGVYALAAYTVRRKAREIVIRKLHGAGRAGVAAVLGREFMPLLGVAALCGVPLVGWFAQAWLASFVDRTAAVFWAMPIALGIVLAMTSLAALRHAVAAMNLRPTTALRG